MVHRGYDLLACAARRRAAAAAFVLVSCLGCRGVLPPQAEWLEGTWAWTGTTGGHVPGPFPQDPNQRVVTFSQDRRVVVREHDVIVVTTSFDVEGPYDALEVRFGARVFDSREHIAFRGSDSTMTLVAGGDRCDDCPNRHTFRRVR